MSKIEQYITAAFAVVGILFFVASALGAALPKGSRAQVFFATLAADLRGFSRKGPPDDPPPAAPGGPPAASNGNRSRGPLARVALVGLAVVVLAGCASAQQRAREASAVVAVAVKTADKACAAIAESGTMTRKDAIELADECAVAYNVARRGLLTVQAGVDAWSAASAQVIGCAAVRVAVALTHLVDTVRHAGAVLSRDVAHGVDVALYLSGFAEGFACPK